MEGEGSEEERKHIASSPHELLALSYFRYLEQREFISREKDFFYLDLLKKASAQLKQCSELTQNKNQFEESAILYLELLRVQFPLGERIDYGETHKKFAEYFAIKSKGEPADEKTQKSILLISRVFSLMNVTPPKRWSSKKSRLRVKQKAAIDYDVAVFNTYLNQIRSSLQNFIRSVAYD